MTAEKGFYLVIKALRAVCLFFAGGLHMAAEKGFYLTVKTMRSVCLFFAGSLYLAAEKGFGKAIIHGNRLNHSLFYFVDKVAEVYHLSMESRVERYDEFTFGLIYKERKEENAIWKAIDASLPYSLLLFGVGLLTAMVFLLVRW